MQSSRLYGNAPFDVVLLHGGPGASGSLAPVAERLSEVAGCVEILNSGKSIDDQIYEVYEEVLRHCDLPVIIIGHSWGAWLGWIFTARYPHLLKKLILVSSGPFESKYTGEILSKRLSRMQDEEKMELKRVMQKLNSSDGDDDAFSRLGALIFKADQLNPFPQKNDQTQFQYDVYRKVWPEADQLRQSGKLLEMANKISCPVVALHGNYDPHPFQGVHEPLRSNLKSFNMHILDKCGHYPWLEIDAADTFFRKLKTEIKP